MFQHSDNGMHLSDKWWSHNPSPCATKGVSFCLLGKFPLISISAIRPCLRCASKLHQFYIWPSSSKALSVIPSFLFCLDRIPRLIAATHLHWNLPFLPAGLAHFQPSNVICFMAFYFSIQDDDKGMHCYTQRDFSGFSQQF